MYDTQSEGASGEVQRVPLVAQNISSAPTHSLPVPTLPKLCRMYDTQSGGREGEVQRIPLVAEEYLSLRRRIACVLNYLNFVARTTSNREGEVGLRVRRVRLARRMDSSEAHGSAAQSVGFSVVAHKGP
jgi:hypothetical protein